MSTYMVDGKKMMNICILEILRKYTDSEHTMDQKLSLIHISEPTRP